MDYIAQIILAVRRFDVEGWTDILVIVVLAVFWAVGGILKARSRAKSKSEGLGDLDQQQQPSRKGPAVPSGDSRGRQIQPRPQIQPPRRKVSRPVPAAAEKQQPDRLQTIKPPPQRDLLSTIASLQTDIKKPLGFIDKPLKKLEDKALGLSAKTAQPRPAAELTELEPVLDFADPDELRRAVLHYEILGKPISLRDKSEKIIGL